MMITCVCLMCMSCSSCTEFPMNTDTISLVMLLRSSAPAWNHCLCIEISFVFYIMWLSGNIFFLKMRIPFISFHFEMYRIHCTQNFSYFFLFFKTLTKIFSCLLTFMTEGEKKALICCLFINNTFPL